MPLLTTVIGSYPKPDYLPLPDWFRSEKSCTYNIQHFNQALQNDDLASLKDKALDDVIKEQTDFGISIITDGEIGRETYFLHFCRQIEGFDFENTIRKPIRGGADNIDTPVIRKKIAPKGELFASREWRIAQDKSTVPVKYTLPGPMTILNSTSDVFYYNNEKAGEDLVKVLNREILGLVKAGCQYIQLDEPLLVRETDTALKYGIRQAEECFRGVPDNVTKIVHLCCGYPQFLDQEGYAKADPNAYVLLAPKLDDSIFDCVSIEDAHRHNDLSLFQLFKKKIVILGVVQVACSRVETVEEISGRVKEILRVFPQERLILAPDCGLAFLVDKDIRYGKIRNMMKVANQF